MWRFAAARATGSSHLKTGLPCQDRFACAALPTDTFVAALADGAGSAAMAERGAEIVVDTVVRSLSAALQDGRTGICEILRQAAVEARERTLAVARDLGVEPRELASTLLAAVAGPMGGGALQIGDGVIVVGEGADEWCWVFWPQRGEYANTTHFLTDEDAEAHLQVDALSVGVTDISLLTDGLEPLALHYKTKTVFDRFFGGMFEPLLRSEGSSEIGQLSVALESFLTSPRIATHTDDDVSLVVATRRSATPHP
jgi:protein phosphatase 2C-like protein